MRLLDISEDNSHCVAVSTTNTVTVVSLSDMKVRAVRKWDQLVVDLRLSSDLLLLLGDGSLEEVRSCDLFQRTASGLQLLYKSSQFRSPEHAVLPQYGLAIQESIGGKLVAIYSPESLTLATVVRESIGYCSALKYTTVCSDRNFRPGIVRLQDSGP